MTVRLAKDIHDRIFSAADQLYDEAGRESFPTVDAVRKLARVNMSDASSGMKEWRRAQTVQVVPMSAQIPEAVQRASSMALSALWAEAQSLANETLQAAQASWDAERAEAETLNKQLVEAYEIQADELEASQGEVARLNNDLESQVKERAALQEVCRSLEMARDTADLKTTEIERRASDLRANLDRAYQEATQIKAESLKEREAGALEVKALRADLAASQEKREVMTGEIEGLKAALLALKERSDAMQESHNDFRKKSDSNLDRAYADISRIQSEFTKEREVMTGEIEALRAKSATLKAKLESGNELYSDLRKRIDVSNSEKLAALDAMGKGREQLAELKGEIAALRKQNTELMQLFKVHGTNK